MGYRISSKLKTVQIYGIVILKAIDIQL